MSGTQNLLSQSSHSSLRKALEVSLASQSARARDMWLVSTSTMTITLLSITLNAGNSFFIWREVRITSSMSLGLRRLMI
jgi:hypothetical protein